MSSLLTLCRSFPERRVAAGDTFLEEGAANSGLFVLRQGAVRVMRSGVEVARVQQAGALFGEISAVLNVPATATLVAMEDSVFHVIEHAEQAVRDRPAIALAIAEQLARRLSATTSYLATLKLHQDDGTLISGNRHPGLLARLFGLTDGGNDSRW
ncbi:cyclic nucleotide-binding domain-containing protein [uncultured Abyssibacter sp.]|uniref:Crp/Fnr family transcriptional regulator n=1 Tax=uncultured Abyssibacter sp. TaxID=2320202 RepID=UPI0032B0F1EC